jgi:hypothetical protein
MWNKLTIGTLGTCLCGMLLACGMSSRGEAIAFNDSLVKASKKSDDALRTLSDRAKTAATGDPVQIAAFKKAAMETKQTVAAARAEAKAVKVLSKQSAKDFYDAEVKYFDMREQSIEDFSEMIRLIEDKKMDPFVRSQKLMDIAKKTDAEELRVVNLLRAA